LANATPAIEWFAIGAVVGLAALLRLYHLDVTWFNGDQKRDIAAAMDIAAGRSFPLLGPVVGTAGGHLGPLYFYLIAVPYLVTGATLAGPIFIVLLNLAGIVLLYRFTRTFIGAPVALIASALFAVFPPAVISSRVMWNPGVLPCFTVLFVWSLCALVVDRCSAAVIPLLALLAALTQFHMATLPLVGLAALAIAVSRHSLRMWHLAVGIGLAATLYTPYVVHEATNRFGETRALIDFIGLDQTLDRGRAWPGVAANLILLFRPALRGFVTDQRLPHDDWGAFAALYTVESILFVFGVWVCLSAVARSWQRPHVDDGRPARVSAVLLLWLTVPLIALGLKRTLVYWYYLDVLYPCEFIFAGIGATALLSHAAVGSGILRWAAGGGVIGALVGIVVSQAVFDTDLQRGTAEQGEVRFDVPKLVIGSSGIELAGLSGEQITRIRAVVAALPYWHHEKLLQVLHGQFRVDRQTLWQRVHGDVLGLPTENEYFVRQIFSRDEKAELPAQRQHYLVERSTSLGALGASGGARVGPYAIVEYRPKIDYENWNSAWAVHGAVENVPERNWKRVNVPWSGLSDPPLGGNVQMWRGMVTIPPSPCGFQLNVSIAGAEPIDHLWIAVSGRRLAPASQASWASAWHYWRTTGAWHLDCALGTGNHTIVVGVETQKRIMGVDIYEGTAPPRTFGMPTP
jgi:hypothetical protein